MHAQMELAGYVAPQPPRVHHLWGVSVVLAADSLTGTAYLKCSGEHFRAEAAVTRALAARSPLLLPDVVAVEPERGWLLMRDLDAPELGDQPESTWGVGLDALAALQQTWLGRTDELLALGAEDRPLTALAVWVEELATDAELLNHLTPDERAQWSAAVPAMVESCRRLADLGPGPSLVHGDFHPWNVTAGAGGARVFDWTDASVAHPFLDLVTYVMRSSDPGRRGTMLRRYLEHWTAHLSADALEEAGRLALVVGALHQAHTYVQLIPTVMPDDLGQLRNGDVQWIRRAMRYAELGLETGY
jgi:aminoglycoside/choline kinase family phosphotransferase